VVGRELSWRWSVAALAWVEMARTALDRRAMIRVYFSEADLARVMFGIEPDPLWVAALGARALGDRPIPQAARRWRRQAAVTLRPSMRPLFKLIAPTGQFPGFLTPELAEPGLEPAVAQLIETPADIIRGQLEPWLPARSSPG
jgi:hypothetical protein